MPAIAPPLNPPPWWLLDVPEEALEPALELDVEDADEVPLVVVVGRRLDAVENTGIVTP